MFLLSPTFSLNPFPHEVPARKTMHDLMWQLAVWGEGGGGFDRTFFDVRVFNPHAPSSQIAASYRRHEGEKRNKYEQRIREIEHATFAPFVLSSSGGMGPCAMTIPKRLQC